MSHKITSNHPLSTRPIDSLRRAPLEQCRTHPVRRAWITKPLIDPNDQLGWPPATKVSSKELVHLLFDAIHLADLRKHRLNAGILIQVLDLIAALLDASGHTD